MRLTALEESFAICKLPPDAGVPEWAARGPFSSVTRTADELSLVAVGSAVPEGVEHEPGWRCLKVEGPLDFSLVGILASLAAPLAEAGISLFAVSTFDTDYLLVKAERFEDAQRALERAGHAVDDGGPVVEPSVHVL